jgi:hypothetical protein
MAHGTHDPILKMLDRQGAPLEATLEQSRVDPEITLRWRGGVRHLSTCSKEASVITQSIITCPHCAIANSETMPTDACQFFYVCTGCGVKFRTKQSDCCGFCFFGSVPFPPSAGGRGVLLHATVGAMANGGRAPRHGRLTDSPGDSQIQATRSARGDARTRC